MYLGGPTVQVRVLPPGSQVKGVHGFIYIRACLITRKHQSEPCGSVFAGHEQTQSGARPNLSSR